MEVQAPDFTKIPIKDLLGVTVLMVTAMYRQQEFFRCSYFVYNDYPSDLSSSKEQIDISKVTRNILVKEPRIRYNEILWEGPKETEFSDTRLKELMLQIKNKPKKIRKKRKIKKDK